MSFSIRCADSGADCPAVFTTQTEDELMDHIRVHAAAAHPDLELTPETRDMIRGLVRST
jgi:predicted small metal-binding protein